MALDDYYIFEGLCQKIIEKDPSLWRNYNEVTRELCNKISKEIFGLDRENKSLSTEEQKELALKVNLEYFSKNPHIPEVIKAIMYNKLFNPFLE